VLTPTTIAPPSPCVKRVTHSPATVVKGRDVRHYSSWANRSFEPLPHGWVSKDQCPEGP
jgi:hypothetical protein